MTPWNETGIGIVFFTGLLLSIITGIGVLIFLMPVKKPVDKITGNSGRIWFRSFLTTVMLAAFLGALSVSFRNCKGDYDELLNSRRATVMKGMEQVSSSLDYLSWTLGFWLIIFLAVYIIAVKKTRKTPEREV
jgi:hypothetical protein